jgi:hypothetical protein
VMPATLACCGMAHWARRTLVCSVIEGSEGSWAHCCCPSLLIWTAWLATASTTWAFCALVCAGGLVATVGLALVVKGRARPARECAVGKVPQRKGTPLGWRGSGGRRVCAREGGASQTGGVGEVLVNTIHGSRQSRKNGRGWLRYRRVCVWPWLSASAGHGKGKWQGAAG